MSFIKECQILPLRLLHRFSRALGSFVSYAPPLYPNPLAEIAVEEEAVQRVVPECLEARGESIDWEEMIDVVVGAEGGIRNGAESEGFTFVKVLRRANLIAASDPETVIDSFGMPTGNDHFLRSLCLLQTLIGHYAFHATSLMRPSKIFVRKFFLF